MLVDLLTSIFASSSPVRPDGLFLSRLQQEKAARETRNRDDSALNSALSIHIIILLLPSYQEHLNSDFLHLVLKEFY